MGVIHKLKEDVTAFIIDQKKHNPSIGVRQIAAITSEKFQIKVSKSSVSSTLKSASLSSSIGRRSSRAAGTAKFTIPSNKKIEILKNIQKSGFAKDGAKEGLAYKKEGDSAEAQAVKKEGTLPLIPDPVTQEKRQPVDEKNEERAPVDSTPQDEDFFKHVKQLRDQRKGGGAGEVLSGMGFAFLKAAQWEAENRSLMSELFKSHVPVSAHNDFDAACEVFLFLKFLGVHSLEDAAVYQKHGLWKLNKFSDRNGTPSGLKELFQWSGNVADAIASGIVVEYDLKKKYIFTEGCGFQLDIEDGTKLTINTAVSSFSPGAKAPINKSMAWLSNYFISNACSPVLLTAPGERMFDQAFYDMVAIFENSPGKKIQKASVLDQDGKEIVGFSTVPAQRRTFLAGVMPKQKEFADLTKNAKWARKKPFYHRESDRVVFYGETKTDGLAAKLGEKGENFRIIPIWQNKEESPFWAILTNQTSGSSEDILRTYMSRWPYFGETEQEIPKGSQNGRDGNVSNITTQKSGIMEFQEIFTDFVGTLSRYCQQRYFPSQYSTMDISGMMRTVYDISGKLYEEKDCIIVSLDVPVESSHRLDIEYAAKCVNERHIFDHFGRKLWIEI